MNSLQQLIDEAILASRSQNSPLGESEIEHLSRFREAIEGQDDRAARDTFKLFLSTGNSMPAVLHSVLLSIATTFLETELSRLREVKKNRGLTADEMEYLRTVLFDLTQSLSKRP